MAEQLNIIISILAALFTGGFLMIFIESQKVAGSVTEKISLYYESVFSQL